MKSGIVKNIPIKLGLNEFEFIDTQLQDYIDNLGLEFNTLNQLLEDIDEFWDGNSGSESN